MSNKKEPINKADLVSTLIIDPGLVKGSVVGAKKIKPVVKGGSGASGKSGDKSKNK